MGIFSRAVPGEMGMSVAVLSEDKVNPVMLISPIILSHSHLLCLVLSRVYPVAVMVGLDSLPACADISHRIY